MIRRRFITLAVIIAAIHIGLVLFFGIKKEGFHEDEYYTYWSVSVPADSMQPGNFVWKTGYELQNRFFVSDSHRFDYGMVVQNQVLDVHPPLYYLALHTLMSFFPNSFYKWFGIMLNLLFSLISYVCILALFYYMSDKIIQKRELAALLAGLVYAVMPSTISAVMLTRMYAMSTMWSTAYTLIFVLLMKNRRMNQKQFGFLLAAGALVCYFAFLTHYFALFLPFFLTAAYCIYTFFYRIGIVRMLIFGSSCLMSVALGVLSFPASLQHIFGGYRGTGVIQGLLNGSLSVRLPIFTSYMQTWIFSGIMYPCLIVFTVTLAALTVMLIRKNGWKNVHNFVCRMLAVFLSLILSYILLSGSALIVGSAACRYFYPIVALLFPYMAYTVWGTFSVLGDSIKRLRVFSEKRPFVKGILGVCITIAMLLPAMLGYCKKNVLFLYEEDAEKVTFSQKYREYPAIMVFNSDIAYRSWYIDNQLWPFEQVFYMTYDGRDSLDEIKLRTADKIVVYMDAPEDLLEQLIAENPHLSGYTLVRHEPFFYIYLLE